MGRIIYMLKDTIQYIKMENQSVSHHFSLLIVSLTLTSLDVRPVTASERSWTH